MRRKGFLNTLSFTLQGAKFAIRHKFSIFYLGVKSQIWRCLFLAINSLKTSETLMLYDRML
jgi:hypothetical protein